MRARIGLALVVVIAATLAYAFWPRGGAAVRAAAVDIDLGRTIYAEQCAACHGSRLRGQPDWKNQLANGRYPAPPHDPSGHTWHHSDMLLTRIVAEGTAAVVGGGYESDMPGFAGVLSEAEIASVLGFIKSTWPAREAEFQRQITLRDAG